MKGTKNEILVMLVRMLKEYTEDPGKDDPRLGPTAGAHRQLAFSLTAEAFALYLSAYPRWDDGTVAEFGEYKSIRYNKVDPFFKLIGQPMKGKYYAIPVAALTLGLSKILQDESMINLSDKAGIPGLISWLNSIACDIDVGQEYDCRAVRDILSSGFGLMRMALGRADGLRESDRETLRQEAKDMIYSLTSALGSDEADQ
ncbi:MAG: hypothetical protein MJY67_07590 [Bacteroidales bacterium]|nr:hypothetical protein [Bacteroidales bacterium]